MAVNLINVECPQCGAGLNIESNRQFAFCSYCGAKVIINNENEHIYRTIDEAGIKQAETERIIRLKEIEIEEKEKSRSRLFHYLIYGLAAALILFGAIVCIFDESKGILPLMFGLCIGMYTFMFTDMGKDKKKKVSRYVAPGQVMITESMRHNSEKNVNEIYAKFNSAGFINVRVVPLNDLNVFTMGKNGQVESVSINGNNRFEEGETYPNNAAVLITYHTKA